MRFCATCFTKSSLGNLSKGHQQFVDAVVLISAPDWSERLSNHENVVVTRFECSLLTSNNARFCQTEVVSCPDLPKCKAMVNPWIIHYMSVTII